MCGFPFLKVYVGLHLYDLVYHSNCVLGLQSNPLNRIAFLPKNFMQLTEAVHHVLEDRKMTFARLCNYAGYAIIRYAIKRVRPYPKIV